jgi:spermidine synthase
VVSKTVQDFRVVFEAESLYGWVRVVDDTKRGFRLLLSDASVLSAVDLQQDKSVLGYQQILGLLPLMRPETATALLIGLGGGHVARDLNSKGIPTDTIEIDPAVAEAARRYFNFEPKGLFLVGDARYEIKRLGSLYDLIVHDCFTGGSEPTHLLSREMLSELRSRLTAHGMLALNYVGFTAGNNSEAVAAVNRTLKALFPHVRVFVTSRKDLTDFVFLASPAPITLDPPNHDRHLHWLLEHEYHPAGLNGITITDDYNPMEHMQVWKSEAYRKMFLERIPLDLLLR